MALSTVIQAVICFMIFTGSCEDIIETTPDAKPTVEGPTNGPNTSRFKMTSLPTTQPVPGRNLIMSQTQAISGGIAKEFLDYTSSGNVTEGVTWNGSTGAADEDTNEYVKRLVKAEKVLWLYVSPVLMWTGTVANILCIVVLQSPQFRRAPSSLTLTLLALTDIANLWVALLRRWVLYVTDNDIDLLMFGQVSCKATYFFVSAAESSAPRFSRSFAAGKSRKTTRVERCQLSRPRREMYAQPRRMVVCKHFR